MQTKICQCSSAGEDRGGLLAEVGGPPQEGILRREEAFVNGVAWLRARNYLFGSLTHSYEQLRRSCSGLTKVGRLTRGERRPMPLNAAERDKKREFVERFFCVGVE